MALADTLSAWVAASGLARLAPPTGPLLLVYHGVGGADGLPLSAFEAQLDELARRRRVVTLHDAVAALGNPRAHELAAITFDDGYRDFASLAVPALRARGLHATVFVPAGHLGGWNAWDAGRAERRELMDAAELRALDPACAEVGAHGHDHVRLHRLGGRELARETSEARRVLEQATQRPVRLFAYPYGLWDDFDAAAEAAVASAGFEAACSTHFGRGSSPAERYRLRRVGVEAFDSLASFQRKLEGAYDWTAWKEDLGLLRRRLAGAQG
jgi:peptidoglycan/xylan/chitin deacetylase (PgdA/CDA1 family)